MSIILVKNHNSDNFSMNRPVAGNEIMEKSPRNKSPGPHGFPSELYQTFKELTPIFLKLFQKIEEDEILPNLLYEAIISLISKPKTLQNRKITGQYL